MRRVIAVDFDGTITLTDGSLHTAEDYKPTPNYAMIDRISRHHEDYDFIVIFTARPEVERYEVMQLLLEWGVKYDAIVMGKLRYDLLYDDRAISPLDNRWPVPIKD